MAQSITLTTETMERWQRSLGTLVERIGADAVRVVRASPFGFEIILSLGEQAGSFSVGSGWDRLAAPLLEAVAGNARPLAVLRISPRVDYSGSPESEAGFDAYLGRSLYWPDGSLFAILDGLKRDRTPFLDQDISLLEHFARGMEDQLALLVTSHDHSRAVEELRAQQERISLAAEVVGMGIWDYNIDDDVLQCDATCYKIYGLDPAGGQMRGIADFKALVHPGDVDRITDERIAELATRTQDRHVDFRLIRPSGETRWITSATCMLHATETTPNRLVGVVIDITEARDAERKLKNSYDTLKRAERVAKVGSWLLTLETGAFTSSEMLNEMNGMDPAGPPLTPGDLQRMLSPESFDRVSAAIARCVETGVPYSIDAVHFRPDGSSFACNIRGEAIRDATGQIVALTGTVQDISEREDARAQLEALADNLPSGGIYRMERDAEHPGRFVYASAGIEMLLGSPIHEIVSEDYMLGASFDPSDRGLAIDAVADSETNLSEYDFRARHRKPDGNEIWLRFRAVPRRVGDKTVWDGLMLDVTRDMQISRQLQNAKEAAEAGERAKADFLAMMSHEIRTPMNTVIGMTRLVQQTDLSPKQRNYLDKIDLSAKALLSIINDVLDYSKIEAGMLALEDTEFELEEVLETISAVTAMRADEKGIEIAFSVAPDVPRRLRGDPFRLGQVLTNLVGNAIKFTEEGEIVVSVRLKNAGPAVSGASILAFSVRDTGIGIDPEQIAQLFRPFSQAESRTSRRYGGTGLGLAICRQLVDLMGGRIDVRSEPGRGSDFHFTISIRPASGKEEDLQMVPNSVLAGGRVLIVDDNASAREILSNMVGAFGMDAEVASSGAEGIDKLRHASQTGQPFEIVLMDWRMPEMDGLEAARRIREEENLPHLPAVLMVTAYGRDEVLQKVEQLHLQGLLIKPITESVMFNTLTEILAPSSMVVEAGTKPVGNRRQNDDPRILLAGRKVLVVDDNALNREVASDFLELVGIVVATATNGREAIEALENEAFDAVLMDVHMPVMDGIEATKAIRRRAKWSSLPIIALTAQARPEDRAIVEAAGMSEHLSKPIDEGHLYSVLISLLPGAMASLDRANTLDFGVGPYPAQTQLDMGAVRKRFGGNLQRIDRMLRGFLRDFKNAPEDFERLAAHPSGTQLAELAHLLKGAVGYLGAVSIQQNAGQLERAARQRDAAGGRILLEKVVKDLRLLLAEVASEVEKHAASEIDHAANDYDGTGPLIGQARALLLQGDYDAVKILEELAVWTTQPEHKAILEQVLVSFDDLRLEDAVTRLDRLSALLMANKGSDGQ